VLDVAPDRSVALRVTPPPDRITLHAFALDDRQLQLAWGDTLYQIRLHFERVAVEGQCDIVLSPRALEGSATASFLKSRTSVRACPNR
jgi:hypothetical protein